MNSKKADTAIKLSDEIVTKNDIRSVIADLQAVDTFLHQTSVRMPGTKMSIPKTSQALESMAKDNQLSLLQPEDRQKLTIALHRIDVHAPVLRFTFAAHPAKKQLSQFTGWLRQTIHPHVLVNYAVRPEIGAGCILKTSKQQIDLSYQSLIAPHNAWLRQQLTA